MNLAPYLEYTLLQPTTTIDQVIQTCEAAKLNGVAAVCAPPLFVKKTKQLLQASSVKVATAIGFPLGYSAIEAKLAEILLAIVDGADELNVVINYMAVKNNDWTYLANEINHILPVVKSKGKMMKVVLEACKLNAEEIERCCQIYSAAGVDYIDCSTGFFEDASLEEVKFISSKLISTTRLKFTAKHIANATAMQLVNLGVSRIGTSPTTANTP